MPCGDASFFRSLQRRNAPHAWATLPSNSVAQWCCAARSGNTSAPFRRPRVPRRTPWATFPPHSVAQRCRAARPGDTYAQFCRPAVPRRTLGEHFCPVPSPKGAAPHARGTLLPVSVAQWCRAARPGDTYARFRRRGGRGKGGGRGGRSMGDGREAGQGRSLGRGLGLGQGKGRGRAYIKEPRTS